MPARNVHQRRSATATSDTPQGSVVREASADSTVKSVTSASLSSRG